MRSGPNQGVELASLQIHKYTHTRIHKHSNTQLHKCKYTNTLLVQLEVKLLSTGKFMAHVGWRSYQPPNTQIHKYKYENTLEVKPLSTGEIRAQSGLRACQPRPPSLLTQTQLCRGTFFKRPQLFLALFLFCSFQRSSKWPQCV